MILSKSILAINFENSTANIASDIDTTCFIVPLTTNYAFACPSEIRLVFAKANTGAKFTISENYSIGETEKQFRRHQDYRGRLTL